MRALSALVIVGLALCPLAHAGEDVVAGNWQLYVVEDGQSILLRLIQLENKKGKLVGKVDSLNRFSPTTMTEAKVVGDLLEFTMKDKKGRVYTFQGKLPKAVGKKILGSLALGSAMLPATLEATSAKNSFELDRDLVVRTPNDPRVFGVLFSLIAQAQENKAPAKDVQEWVDAVLTSAERFGPRWQFRYTQQTLDALLTAESYPTVAVATAQKTVRLMDIKAPPEARLRVLTALGMALKQAGQTDQAKQVEARLEQLELKSYQDYQASALDFKVAKFPGRKSKSNRAVLFELFTGAQCPPCAAADLAFDAMAKAYDTKEVVLLQYHVHIPGPDALTNADTNERAAYYEITGTPTFIFNGKGVPLDGGPSEKAPDVFAAYSEIADHFLETPASAQLQVAAARKGDKIQIKAAVTDLAKPGPKVKLRLALVEDWVRYKGGNGITYSHQVVRAFPGGVEGMALTKKDTERTAAIDIGELRQNLTKYLDTAAKEEPFLDTQRPMRLRNLSVVAFVQDDATKQVLQAAQAPVTEE
jgi:hypothetical protein